MIKKAAVPYLILAAVAIWVIARWIPASGGIKGSYTFKA